MSVNDTETFLVVQHSLSTSFVQAFFWQGSYEDAYKLDHSTAHVDLYLIQPDPTEPAGRWGQALQHVGTLRCTGMVSEHVAAAAYYLRQLPDKQRKEEVTRAIERLQREADSLTQAEGYPATIAGNLQRLTDYGIEPLSEEQRSELRRD